ncbi:hypothetical protein [Christiangramia sp.]|uniref:hypothetical protein n=1 Tax=Christiangramia sp. TaxID=1931228 RepID=UPI00261523E1|nr:hypothetical protein [Christiangramia sp.]
MKTIYLTILLISLNVASVFAQDQDLIVLDKFIILDATENGVDITPQLLENEAFLSFFELADENHIYFANVWPVAESMSHGVIYDAEFKDFEETEETYAQQKITFTWKYQNSYDGISGNAKVKINKIYKPQGVYFEAVIIPEDLDLLVYKGYIDGTLDLAVYDQ